MINPENRQRLNLVNEKTGILGLYTSNRGIYHATETVSQKSKLMREGESKVPREFGFNYVTIFDAISGTSI